MGQKGINFIDKPCPVPDQDQVDFKNSCQSLLKLKTLGEIFGGTYKMMIENY